MGCGRCGHGGHQKCMRMYYRKSSYQCIPSNSARRSRMIFSQYSKRTSTFPHPQTFSSTIPSKLLRPATQHLDHPPFPRRRIHLTRFFRLHHPASEIFWRDAERCRRDAGGRYRRGGRGDGGGGCQGLERLSGRVRVSVSGCSGFEV